MSANRQRLAARFVMDIFGRLKAILPLLALLMGFGAYASAAPTNIFATEEERQLHQRLTSAVTAFDKSISDSNVTRIADQLVDLNKQYPDIDPWLAFVVAWVEDDGGMRAEMRYFVMQRQTHTAFVTEMQPALKELDRVVKGLDIAMTEGTGELKDRVVHYYVGSRKWQSRTGVTERRVREAEEAAARVLDRYSPSDPGKYTSGGTVVSDGATAMNSADNAARIRQDYINVMRYYNPRLDDRTANIVFDTIRTEVQKRERVDARLVMALVACESSFKPRAVSSAGARGLGQLMPHTARQHNVNNIFDPEQNLRACIEYLDREIAFWEDYPPEQQLDRVLASYNAGRSAVVKYGGIPPYSETRTYVRRVKKLYERFTKED